MSLKEQDRISLVALGLEKSDSIPVSSNYARKETIIA